MTGIKRYVKKKLAVFFYKIINSREYREIIAVEKEDSQESHKKLFKNFGRNSELPDLKIIMNPQYISIGDNFSSLYNLRMEAWDQYEGVKFTPEIIIGNNVSINTDCHIGAINRISIGNNVLIASRVYISDHAHGSSTLEAVQLTPVKRPLVSAGPVIIEDNVWIGEGVCILAGVRIGRNSIIGANAVVTSDIPENNVAAGVPAKILKRLE